MPRTFTTELAAPVHQTVHVLHVADPSLALTVCAYTRPATCPPAAWTPAEQIIAAHGRQPVMP